MKQKKEMAGLNVSFVMVAINVNFVVKIDCVNWFCSGAKMVFKMFEMFSVVCRLTGGVPMSPLPMMH